MCADKSYVSQPVRVVKTHHEAILVARDIKHDSPVADDTGMTKLLIHVLRARLVGLARNCVPRFERLLAIPMPGNFPKFPDGLEGNDPHLLLPKVSNIIVCSPFGNKGLIH